MAVYPNYKETTYINVDEMTPQNTMQMVDTEKFTKQDLNFILLDKKISALWLNQMTLIDKQEEDDKARPIVLRVAWWGNKIFSWGGAVIGLIVASAITISTAAYIEGMRPEKGNTEVKALKELLRDNGLLPVEQKK